MNDMCHMKETCNIYVGDINVGEIWRRHKCLRDMEET